MLNSVFVGAMGGERDVRSKERDEDSIAARFGRSCRRHDCLRDAERSGSVGCHDQRRVDRLWQPQRSGTAADGDGDSDVDDILAVIASFGQGDGGDVDGDGDTDVDDILQVISWFGAC